MSIVSTTANYGGKATDNQQGVKQFFVSSNQTTASWVYKRQPPSYTQSITPADPRVPVVVEPNLTVRGDLFVDGSIYNPSDIRLKRDIQPLWGASLERMTELTPVSFRYHSDPTQLHYGMIAQEVGKIYPHLVQTSIDGFQSVNYLELVPLLWAKIVQLEDRVSELCRNQSETSNRTKIVTPTNMEE